MADQERGKFYGAVTVSERGQVVIPAQARRDLDIEVGEKLLVVSGPGRGLLLIRARLVGQMLSQWADLIQLLQEEGFLETKGPNRMTTEGMNEQKA
ncbi:MAG: AbrB/MazE/SpoVT family DNA-binding domain-containing protein [Anaerolineae bacterium]|jgi:AbrB family looped-hinge helix DNA binding protein